jgi:hypothetical protein
MQAGRLKGTMTIFAPSLHKLSKILPKKEREERGERETSTILLYNDQLFSYASPRIWEFFS